ncbi:MAG: hypothetical protein JKY37_30665 [Nannocystaceae bacterium]|nr:hypothetical protein [Nannocystaceae bacterium]
MRWLPTLSLLIPFATSACFEDASPSGASTGEDCAPGTEGCGCIEEECIGGLTCLSATCVDPNPTGTSGSGSGSGGSMDTTESGDDALDESGLPAESLCDPFNDACAPELACVYFEADGISCAAPGPRGPGEVCDIMDCGPQLICYPGSALNSCNIGPCCTELCELARPGNCPEPLVCRPFYTAPEGAPPGYDHIGVCLNLPKP